MSFNWYIDLIIGRPLVVTLQNNNSWLPLHSAQCTHAVLTALNSSSCTWSTWAVHQMTCSKILFTSTANSWSSHLKCWWSITASWQPTQCKQITHIEVQYVRTYTTYFTQEQNMEVHFNSAQVDTHVVTSCKRRKPLTIPFISTQASERHKQPLTMTHSSQHVLLRTPSVCKQRHQWQDWMGCHTRNQFHSLLGYHWLRPHQSIGLLHTMEQSSQ